MSKGNIKKPRNPEIPDNLYKKPIDEAIYYVVQTCEVEVENTEWLNADEALKDKLTRVDEKLKTDIASLDGRLKEIDKRLGDNQGNVSDDLKGLRSEIENLKVRRPLELIVKTPNGKTKDLGLQHSQLPTLLSILSTKLNVYLVGPAGAGKTHAAIQCAKALDIPFHFTGAVASEFKLTGFMNAQGTIVLTEFRKAYEHGGLFLFDEIDASYPQAVLAFNAALANDYMDFPDKRVTRHENFYCIAAANTYGQGADRQYIGRNQLDAASLDRFVFIDWKYDENLESMLAANEEWSSHVQKVRKFVEQNKMRHVVSPRASIFGAKLLQHGIDRETVSATVLWKGIDQAAKQKILEGIKPKKDVVAERAGQFTPKVQVGTSVMKDQVIGEIYDSSNWNDRVKKVVSPCDGVVGSFVGKNEDDDSIAVTKGQVIAHINV